MDWSDPDIPPWEVPDYLAAPYVLWSLVGSALIEIATAHKGVHMSIEEGDTLMRALSEAEVSVTFEDGEVITSEIHGAIAAAQESLAAAAAGIVEYLDAAEMLPPWWDEMMQGREDG